MLRRPPTTLTLTAEDIAMYEDRRFASQSQAAQSQNQLLSPPAAPQAIEMDTSSSSLTPSPPPPTTIPTTTTAAAAAAAAAAAGGDDEDMHDASTDTDAQAEEEEEESDDDDPFITGPRRAAREQLNARPVSPGQARAAYLSQMRAGRQAHQHPSAAAQTRMQRITGAAQQARAAGSSSAAERTTRSRPGSTEPANTSAPGRMMTRSREERIGIAGQTGGGGTGTGAGAGATGNNNAAGPRRR
ncbi:hypothetical protein GGS26DRAFT_106524 [Hypomontagnella submonticulosa]|nr:hypothetical protein GGS26DRAFT_106524 [Hypomontagnella submonticulosa]